MRTRPSRGLRRLRLGRFCTGAVITAALLALGPLSVNAQDSALSLPEVTVADVLSAPHPSGLSAAPTGEHMAWVFNDRGTRDVWVASAPEYLGQRVTDFAGTGLRPGASADDGQEIGSIAWSPNGESLAFVRGGPPNAAGELPNPLSLPDGVERAVWRYDLGTGSATKVGVGRSPLWLDHNTLLIQRKGKVVRIDFGKAPKKRGQRRKQTEADLLAVRGGINNLRLSPDRSRLAFVSRRGSHSFIGVLEFESNRVAFLDAAVDQDGSPVFSPDGRSLAFVRQPPVLKPEIFAPMRAGAPWSIRVVDLASGAAREVFRAKPGVGSVYRDVVADDQLIWTDDGFLVFPSEADGWTHLYGLPVLRPSLTSAGSRRPSAQLLTPGQFEVEYVAAARDGKSVLFSSNQDDIDRRHLWRVAAAGGAVQAVTQGKGVENTPTPLADGAIAYVAASGTRPLEPMVRFADGSARSLAPGSLPASFPLEAMVEPEQVVFAASDGMKIHGQLFKPKTSTETKRPAVIFFHGGSRRHMMLGWHYSSYYHNCYAFHQYLVNQGYVVLSVNYRSGIGYGMEFREALDYGATGGSELRDVLGAGLYLRSRDDVDGSRVGLWGGSYGGYLTAMGLSRASDLFAAGVDIHGVHDWNRTIKNFIPSYEPLEDPDRARLAFESSPMAQVEDWRSPVLLVHGDDDRNVPFLETVVLVEKLRELGVEHELLVYPDEVHSFLRYQHWVEIFERAGAFFNQHLGVAAAAQEFDSPARSVGSN